MNKHCRDGTWWYINTIIWNHGYISRWWRIHDKQFCVHNQNWRLLNREDWKFTKKLGRKIWNTDLGYEDSSRTKRRTLTGTIWLLFIMNRIVKRLLWIMSVGCHVHLEKKKKGCYLNNCEKHCDVYLFVLFMQ